MSGIQITIFDHVFDPDGIVPNTPDDQYGSDYIAGGPDDDMIFGQLGDDTIQGDGEVNFTDLGETPDASIDVSAVRDSASIRRTALLRNLPYFTTAAGARAAAGAIRALQQESIGVRTLQEIHGLEDA